MEKQTLLALPKERLVEIILDQQKQIDELKLAIAKLQKNSSNSSNPPSRDMSPPTKKGRDINSRVRSENKTGGQKGHQGMTRTKAKKPDEIRSCKPKVCFNCRKSLDGKTGKIVNTRQEIDIPEIKAKVIEYQQYEIECECGHCNRGEFPNHLKATGVIQVGKNLTSFLVYPSSTSLQI